MSLSPQFLDEVRARTTLSTLIGKSIKVQKAGREYKACCPFHNEKTPSFTINDEKGFYHCFGCGEHGDAIRWMTEQRGLTFMDAVKELAETAGLALPAPDPYAARKAEAARTLHDVMAAAQSWFVEQLNGIEGAEARTYLDKRGMKPETVKTFGFGYAPDSRGKLKAALKEFDEGLLIEAGMLIKPEDGKKDSYDRFRGRLMIPIRDARGRVIAFGGRILGAGEPKYLNSPDTPLFDKGRTLYNLDKAAPAARKSDRMIVVEGYMDAIALSQAGFADVVAPLGTALTENQIEKLWSMVETPTLCFDGDSAGQKAADRAMLRAIPMLKPGYSLAIASLPVGVDPDDLLRLKGTAAFQLILETAQPLADRLWTYELAQGETDTPERRAGLKARLNERVSGIGDTLVKQEYSKQLQDKFFENFGWGWRKSEVNGVRRAIDASRAEASDSRIDVKGRIERQTFRAVLLGVSRWPSILYDHREQLQALHLPTEDLTNWRDILVSASYERPALEEDLIEAILASSDIRKPERRDLQHDLAFSFFFKSSDRQTAETDLIEVIRTLVVEQDLAARLAALATELYAPEMDDAAYGRKLDEHHGLLKELMQYRERLALLRADAENWLAAA
jgi:DNA primase